MIRNATVVEDPATAYPQAREICFQFDASAVAKQLRLAFQSLSVGPRISPSPRPTFKLMQAPVSAAGRSLYFHLGQVVPALGPFQIQSFKRLPDRAGDDIIPIPFVVGGDDVPRRVFRAATVDR